MNHQTGAELTVPGRKSTLGKISFREELPTHLGGFSSGKKVHIHTLKG